MRRLPGGLGLVQPVAHLAQRRRETDKLVIHIAGPFGDLPRILALVFIAPHILDHLQVQAQGRGADQKDPVFEGVLKQALVLFQRQHQGRLDGHEHQHHVE